MRQNASTKIEAVTSVSIAEHKSFAWISKHDLKLSIWFRGIAVQYRNCDGFLRDAGSKCQHLSNEISRCNASKCIHISIAKIHYYLLQFDNNVIYTHYDRFRGGWNLCELICNKMQYL